MVGQSLRKSENFFFVFLKPQCHETSKNAINFFSIPGRYTFAMPRHSSCLFLCSAFCNCFLDIFFLPIVPTRDFSPTAAWSNYALDHVRTPVIKDELLVRGFVVLAASGSILQHKMHMISTCFENDCASSPTPDTPSTSTQMC